MDDNRIDAARRQPPTSPDPEVPSPPVPAARTAVDLDSAVASLPEPSWTTAFLVQQNPVGAAARLMKPASTTPAPTLDSAAAAPPPLPVAPNAFHGIQLMLLVEGLPHTDSAPVAQAIPAGNYRLHPQTAKQPDGSSAVTHYVAYNVDTKRSEFAVGPDSVGAFKSQTPWFGEAAALAYSQGEPKTKWERESMRAMDAVMREGFGAGASHFASAWNAAVRDPEWWTRTVLTAVTAPIVLETGTPILGRLASRGSNIVETALARAGMAKPLLSAAELKPLTQVERQAVTDFLLKAKTPPVEVEKILSGCASGVRIETLAEDTEVVRYSGGDAKPVGRWLTEQPVANPVRDLALDTGKNTAKYLDKAVIPKGTTVLRSPVAGINGQPGGATQLFVPDPTVLRAAGVPPWPFLPSVVNTVENQSH